MKKPIWILCLLLCMVLFVSCQQATDDGNDTIQLSSIETPMVEPSPNLSPLATPTRQPYIFSISEPGTVTIHGELLAMDPDNLPDPNDAIFLVPLPDEQVVMIPSFTVGEVPQADVDEVTGEFVFTNIEPGRYAIVVKMIWNAQIPARTDEGNFVILHIKETDCDKTIELGDIRIP